MGIDLSIVVALRNDYYDNQAYRICVFLRTLDDLTDKYDLTTEIIAVEWNPIPDRPPLKEMLDWPDNTRIITVPQKLHRQYKHSDILDFYQMIAKNVGIQRARGEWILATNPDVVFSEDLVAYLAKLEMRPRHLYRAFRHDLSTPFVEGGTTDEVLNYCQQNVEIVHSSMFMGVHSHACGDFTLLHQDAWANLRGYPEFDLWSIHIDCVFLAMARAAGFTERVLPDACRVYHIKHPGSWMQNKERALMLPHLDIQKDVIPMFQTMYREKQPLCINGPDWGLANEQLEES